MYLLVNVNKLGYLVLIFASNKFSSTDSKTKMFINLSHEVIE